ncbi:MAG: xanthine dehydrogenase family protein molybdopterin-binding subunit [Kofleriaceae bacterium]
MKSVGTPIDRIDAKKKVTGTATYAADTDVTKIAHAVILTSNIAKGTVAGMELQAARHAPGVIAVMTHLDAPRVFTGKKGPGPAARVLQLLQSDAIEYADQPIAVVVADTLERAQHAAALIVVKYAPAAAVASIEQALGSAYTSKALAHGEPDSNRGNFETGFGAAKFKHEATYTTPNENHNPMEPHATIAAWRGDELTVYDSTQGIFGVRNRMSEIFGIPKDKVRVIDQFVGGGFGCKGTPWSHVALAAMAAKVASRPVKLAVTRQQMFTLVGHRPHTIQTIKLGCDPEGKLTAIRHDVINETSRFDEFVEPSALQTRMLYACPNVVTTHKVVKIDAPTPTFMRAPGEASGTFAIEAAIDELAYLAKIDPLEFRRRNHTDTDPQLGKPFSSKSLEQCYDAGAKKFGWATRKAAPRAMRVGHELVGYGMATATYPANQQPAAAKATAKPDGTFLVQAGTQDLGTGTYTVMTQLAADALDVPVEKVTFELGDSMLPETPVSGGSMTVGSVGPAVVAACEALKAKLAGTVDRTKEIVAEVKTELAKDKDNYSLHSFGADFVEVRVDEDLGTIRVARVVGAFACGRILNPKTANNQFVGGIVWGIGMALQEDTVRDRRTGRIVTRDLADYHVPVNADIPQIDVISIDEKDDHVNAIGTKGIGEIGITGVTAAIANAVFHATGKRVRDLPIRLDQLLG